MQDRFRLVVVVVVVVVVAAAVVVVGIQKSTMYQSPLYKR
jgi:hypothetical protein